MACIYNIKPEERFCKYCIARCDERPKVEQIRSSTDILIEDNEQLLGLIMDDVKDSRIRSGSKTQALYEKKMDLLIAIQEKLILFRP